MPDFILVIEHTQHNPFQTLLQHCRELEQENHQLALDGDTQQQDLSKKAHEVSDLQQQRTSLTAAKVQMLFLLVAVFVADP